MPGKVKGLFKWCRKVTDGYEGLDLTNLSSCWKNGMALCALINRFRPDLIDYYSLSPENVFFNNDLAFTVAEKELGIPKYLDPIDMVTMEAPDRLSIATYLSEFYDQFHDKYMYDAPEMPPGWPEFVVVSPQLRTGSTLENRSVDELKAENSENFGTQNKSQTNEVTLNVSKNEPNKENDNQQEIDNNDDIDELYKDNLELLESDGDNIGSFNEACRKEIDNIKVAKKGVVIQAVVCAGITAVAATTVGDDDKNDIVKQEDINETKEQHACIKDGASETKDYKVTSNENEKVNDNENDENHVNDDENQHNYAEAAIKPDLLRSDSGIGTANTEVLKETMKNITAENEHVLDKQDSSDTDGVIKIPSDANTCSQKTVELLNAELNKGDISIVNVNIIDSKSSDNSDTEILLPVSETIVQNEIISNEVLPDTHSESKSKVVEKKDSSSSSDNETDTEHDESNENSNFDISDRMLGNVIETETHSGSSSSSSDSETQPEDVKEIESKQDHNSTSSSDNEKDSTASIEQDKEEQNTESTVFINSVNDENVGDANYYSDDIKTNIETIIENAEDHMNALSDKRSSSTSESDTNVEEDFASELVENIFHEVQSNPELLAEIAKELPSIVKEVESGLNMEANDIYIEGQDNDNFEEKPIEVSKVKDIDNEYEFNENVEDLKPETNIKLIKQESCHSLSSQSNSGLEENIEDAEPNQNDTLIEGNEELCEKSALKEPSPSCLKASTSGEKSSISSDDESDNLDVNELHIGQGTEEENSIEANLVSEKLNSSSSSSSSSESDVEAEHNVCASALAKDMVANNQAEKVTFEEKNEKPSSNEKEDVVPFEDKDSVKEHTTAEANVSMCEENVEIPTISMQEDVRQVEEESSIPFECYPYEKENVHLEKETNPQLIFKSGEQDDQAPEIISVEVQKSDNLHLKDENIDSDRKQLSDWSKSSSNSDSEGEAPALPDTGPPTLMGNLNSDNTDIEAHVNFLNYAVNEQVKNVSEIPISVSTEVSEGQVTKERKYSSSSSSSASSSSLSTTDQKDETNLNSNKINDIDNDSNVSPHDEQVISLSEQTLILESDQIESTPSKEVHLNVRELQSSLDFKDGSLTPVLARADENVASISSRESDDDKDSVLSKTDISDEDHLKPQQEFNIEPKTKFDKPVFVKNENLSSSSSSSSSSSESEVDVDTKPDTKTYECPAPHIDLVVNIDKQQYPKVEETEIVTKNSEDFNNAIKVNVEPMIKPIDANVVESNIIDNLDEGTILAKPAQSDVKLEWSNKADEQPILNIEDNNSGKSKYFANVDTDLMKKAALMSKKMAQSITSKMEDQKRLSADLPNKDENSANDEIPPVETPPSTPDLEVRRAKKLAMFRQLQFSTRPTKKKFEEAIEAEGVPDSNNDFRTKLQMFARKSTSTEPDRSKLINSPTGSIHRKKIASPFLESPTTPESDDKKHLKKLHDCLPENPAPGSVAEYIRKLSQSSLPKSQDDFKEPVNLYQDCDSQIELPLKKCNVEHSEMSPNCNTKLKNKVYSLEKDVEDVEDKVHVNPASIFAGRHISRRHTFQDRKLAIRPMSIELRHKEDGNNMNDQDKPPIPPPRLHRKNQPRLNVDIEPLESKPDFSRKAFPSTEQNKNNNQKEKDSPMIKRSDSFNDKVNVEVKSLDKQPTLSDEEMKKEEQKNELKRQESLKRKPSPRRSLIMSSPTRSDPADGDRPRNVWQEPIKKPPQSPKIKRRDSFEIKVRPLSQQLSAEEKESAKKQKELERSSSFNSSSSSRPPTPTQNKKLHVVVQPISALNSHEKGDLVETPKLGPSVSRSDSSESDISISTREEEKIKGSKPPSGKKKTSILSLIEKKIASPRSRDVIDNPVIVDDVCFASTINTVEADLPKKEVKRISASEGAELKPVSKGTGSKIFQYVQSCKEKNREQNLLPDKKEKEKNKSDSFPEDKTKLYKDNERLSVSTNKDEDKSSENRQSKFKEEQEEVIRKCNSIFGAVKARVKPMKKEKWEGLENQQQPSYVDEVGKRDQDNPISEPVKKEQSSTSSSSSSQVSSPSSSPKVLKKDFDKETIEVNVDNNSSNIDLDTNEKKLSSKSQDKNDNDTQTGKECNLNADLETPGILFEGLYQDSEEDKNNKKASNSVSSSPSSHSSAEIQKEDLKEGLKTIIRDLEKDMKSDEENEGKCDVKEQSDEHERDEECKINNKIVSDDEASNDVDANKSEEINCSPVLDVEIQDVHREDVHREKKTVSKSSSSSSDDDEMCLKSEYRRLLNEESVEIDDKSRDNCKEKEKIKADETSSLDESKPELKKKQRKKKKKKRKGSISSSSSESSQNDSDTDDDRGDKKQSKSDTSSSVDQNSSEGHNQIGKQSKDSDRKTSTGSNHSSKSDESKDAHVISINIPGEDTVVLDKDEKNVNNLSSDSERGENEVITKQKHPQELFDSQKNKFESQQYILPRVSIKVESNDEEKDYHADEEHSDTDDEGKEETDGYVEVNMNPASNESKTDQIHDIKMIDNDSNLAPVNQEDLPVRSQSNYISERESSHSDSSESKCVKKNSTATSSSSSSSDSDSDHVMELSLPKNHGIEPTIDLMKDIDNIVPVVKTDLDAGCPIISEAKEIDALPSIFMVKIDKVNQNFDHDSSTDTQDLKSDDNSSSSSENNDCSELLFKDNHFDEENEIIDTMELDNDEIKSKLLQDSSCKDYKIGNDEEKHSDESEEENENKEKAKICKGDTDKFRTLTMSSQSSSEEESISGKEILENNDDKEPNRESSIITITDKDIEQESISDSNKGITKSESSHSSKSDSSSSSDESSAEENILEQVIDANKINDDNSEEENDELLKSVIEDAEPFKAPLLEDVIKSASMEENITEGTDKDGSDRKMSENDAKSNENSDSSSSSDSNESDSSNDLYTDSKSKPEPAQYILPECNKILTEFDVLNKENELFPSPVDVQVFVIRDGPMDKYLYPSLKDPEIVIPCDYANAKDSFEVNEEVIIPLEPIMVEKVETSNTNIPVLEKDKEQTMKPTIEVSDIVLVPLDDTKQDEIVSENEDDLLKNVILQNEMNFSNIDNRKSSTSSASSIEGNKDLNSHSESELEDKHSAKSEDESDIVKEKSIENDIHKKNYVPYENVVIIKKPDTAFDPNYELLVKDIEVSLNRSDSSSSHEDKHVKLCKNKSRTLSDSSVSSVDSVTLGIVGNNVLEDKDSDIKPRSRSSSSSSSDSDSSRSSKSDDESAPENGHESQFLIGREKDPSKSEVARLIQQSLEIDRRREELRKQEQDRLKDLQDQLKPRDEVLEHEHIRHLSEASSKDSKAEDNVDLDESSVEDDVEEQEVEISEELLAGEATPMSMPSAADSDTTDSSPEEGDHKPVVEVFDLQESSPDDISPDMESQALFVKLKEAQCKNAVLEAEITKLKAKLVVLENNEAQKKQYEKKNEEMASRLREMEKSLTNARKEINHYQDMMEGSQGQYIALEKKLKAEYTALEKKYHKAKKLIKEYQQREKDFIAERESLLQQQSEKDQQYDALVKSLKDRIFHLEGELGEAQKAAGLPVKLPPKDQSQSIEATVVPSVSVAVKSAPRLHDSGSPVISPLADRDSISSESDISSADPSSANSTAIDGRIKSESALTFESVPAAKLLDTSVNKAKAQLAANSPRRPPTKQRSKSQDSEEMIEAISENKPESGLETWIKHDSDNTVKKSDVRKRKAQQNESQIPPPVSENPPIIAEAQPKTAEAPPPKESFPAPPPPPAGPPELPDQSEDTENQRDRSNSESGESSSTLSQTSYDPSRPTFRNKDSEIPGLDAVSTDTAGTNDTAETSESSSSAAAANKRSKGLLPKLPFKFGGSDRDKGGGVMLVSQRSIGADDPASAGDGGITLISKKKLDTGLDFDGKKKVEEKVSVTGASTISDTSSGYMVGEMEQTSYSFSGTPANEDHPSQPGHHTLNQFSSGQITEWNNENVRHWLIGIEMERYAPLFTEKSVTGPQLIAMDSNKLKALGVTAAKDRDYLKKKVKELKLVLEKERKQMERERKQIEKEQKQKEKEQKKLSKKK